MRKLKPRKQSERVEPGLEPRQPGLEPVLLNPSYAAIQSRGMWKCHGNQGFWVGWGCQRR